MDGATLHSIWTIVALVTFLGIVWWAWSARRRPEFERAARIPLEDGAGDPGEGGRDG